VLESKFDAYLFTSKKERDDGQYIKTNNTESYVYQSERIKHLMCTEW
jgi:hypothetical protein